MRSVLDQEAASIAPQSSIWSASIRSARERIWQAKRQMRQALPRRIAAVEKANAELRKEAKGLK